MQMATLRATGLGNRPGDMTLLYLSQTPTLIMSQQLCRRTWNVDHEYSLTQENHVDNQKLILCCKNGVCGIVYCPFLACALQ